MIWLQVSWCKLEVTISTPKHIQAECSSLQGRVPPQLVVAAIHVKTRLTAQVRAALCGARHQAPGIQGRKYLLQACLSATTEWVLPALLVS